MRWRWGRRAPSPSSAATRVAQVVIWSRSGCHLCEELERQVRSVAAEDGLSLALEVRDLDDPAQADPALRERLTTLVPVLVVDGDEVGQLRLTDAEVRSVLRQR